MGLDLPGRIRKTESGLGRNDPSRTVAGPYSAWQDHHDLPTKTMLEHMGSAPAFAADFEPLHRPVEPISFDSFGLPVLWPT